MMILELFRKSSKFDDKAEIDEKSKNEIISRLKEICEKIDNEEKR